MILLGYTGPEGRHDITVQLRPVKTSQPSLFYPLTILLSFPLHLQILPKPPWEWLCPCADSSPTRPFNPKPSLSLPHTKEQFPGLESLLQPQLSASSWIVFILVEIRRSWHVGTGFTLLLFGSFLWEEGVQPWIRGLPSHQKPTGQQQHLSPKST